MNLLEEGMGLEEALQGFDFGGRVAGALRYGMGHINDTFAVYTQKPDGDARRFILQRINTHVFRNPVGLMANIVGVTAWLAEKSRAAGGNPERETLTVLRDKTGSPLFRAPDGSCWRCYLFVEGTVCLQHAETPAQYAAAARAFGRFARSLEGYPAGELFETIPFFHDTRRRLASLEAAVAADAFGRVKDCGPEIAFALARRADCATLMDKLDAGLLPLRVTHNDTKLNNVLLDKATGEGVCVIDLDTVMPGLSLHDFGDAIRSGANTAGEEERDIANVRFSLPLYETYATAYLEAAGPALTEAEKRLLPWGAKLMTLECGIRYVTDYLEGDVYFRPKQPGQNLHRARNQFKLVADMENEWQAMNAITLRLAGLQ